MEKTVLAGLLPAELTQIIDFPRRFQADQLFSAIVQGIEDINEITTLSKDLRGTLAEKFTIYSCSTKQLPEDPDGTKKAVIRLADGLIVECVLLRDSDGRKTACLSTQAGCAMGCIFCRTGTMGLERNLTASEIVQQFMIMQNSWGKISHIVFMGMGEPLQNLNELRKSIDWFSHPKGLNISLRKMTVSTCGLLKQLEDLMKNGPAVRIALSLTSADQTLREKLMPVCAGNTLNDLKKIILGYQQDSSRRLTFEYVLLKGVNDREEDVMALRKYLRGINYVINLIPWNPADELDFESPDEKDIQKFLDMAAEVHLNIVRRYRRGNTINGACGQLAVQ